MLMYTVSKKVSTMSKVYLTLDVFFENYHIRLLFFITHSENCCLRQKPIIIDRGKETILSTGRQIYTDYKENRLPTKDSGKKIIKL